jgi:hypothetical protein
MQEREELRALRREKDVNRGKSKDKKYVYGKERKKNEK